MSALSRIRENVGLVIVLIAISLAAFILTDFFTGKTSGNSASDMVAGEVAGQEVSYLEVQRRTELYSRNVTDEGIEQTYELRRQIWQEIVQEVINFKEWDDVGLAMSDAEERMLYYGPIIHPYVFQYPLFQDSLGQFNPEVVRIRFQQADQINENDPNIDEVSRNFKQDMINLKRAIKINRLAAKWEQLVQGGVFVSDNELRRSHDDQQKTVNISYVSVPYASMADQEVTDADYSEYYDENKELFRRNSEMVDIKYTYFPLKPSKKDSANARDEIAKIIPDFRTSDDPYRFAFSNSDTRVVDSSLKMVADLPIELQGVESTDSIVGPVLGEEGYKLLRIVDMITDSAYSIEVRHILVTAKPAQPGQPASAQEKEVARQEANNIRNQVLADPSQFNNLVQTKSDDPNSKAAQGRLGYISPQQYPVIGGTFGRDISNASVGSILVTESNGGFHVVEILDRSNKRYSFAELNQNIIVSTATSDSVYKRASQYAGQVLAGASMDSTLRDFPEANTNASGLLTPSSYSLLGLEAGREVISWAFKAEQDQISEDILDANNALVIAKVTTKGDEGYASLDEVRESITPDVRKYAKGKAIKAKLASAGSGDLASIAAGYGAGATTGSAQSLRFSNNFVNGLGQEPKVVGRAFGLAQGSTSQPIVGQTGVYIVKVDAVNAAPELDEATMTFQRQSLSQTKRQNAVNAAANGLRDLAKVRDYRYRFNY